MSAQAYLSLLKPKQAEPSLEGMNGELLRLIGSFLPPLDRANLAVTFGYRSSAEEALVAIQDERAEDHERKVTLTVHRAVCAFFCVLGCACVCFFTHLSTYHWSTYFRWRSKRNTKDSNSGTTASILLWESFKSMLMETFCTWSDLWTLIRMVRAASWPQWVQLSG